MTLLHPVIASMQLLLRRMPHVFRQTLVQLRLQCGGSWCPIADGLQVAAWIRATVHERTQLTCSVGIAANMMLAKISSDMRKPNGQFEVPCTRDAVMEFVQQLPIRKVPGIGKVRQTQSCACRCLLIRVELTKHFIVLQCTLEDRCTSPQNSWRRMGHELAGDRADARRLWRHHRG
jgi:impB/mucB/samB family/IMS family HHH motif